MHAAGNGTIELRYDLQKCFRLLHMVCPFEARPKVEVDVLRPVECEA